MMKKLPLLILLISAAVQAQDLIIPKQGDPITAYELNISDTYLFYSESIDADAPIRKIAKENVAVVRKADGSLINMSETTPATPVAEVTEQPDRFPIVDLSQYHGYLLQKGNCVYIPTDSEIDYERAGQVEFKRLMKERGYWQVVDKLEQAHFVALFYVDLTGYDFARVYFRTRAKYEAYPHIMKATTYNTNVLSDLVAASFYTGETANENITAARVIVERMSWWCNLEDYRKFRGYSKNNKTFQAMMEDWILP